MSETADHEERLIAAVSGVVFMSSPRGTPGPRSIIALLRRKGVIPPVGAVTLSAEDAELGADGLSRLIARYESLANEHDRSGRTEQCLWERNNAAKYRALAAKLSGGAS